VPFVVIEVPLAEPTLQSSGVSTTLLKAKLAVELTVKPLPVTEKSPPIGPWPGDSAIVGTVTSNGSEFEVVDVVRSVATTSYGPGAAEGTRNVHENEPAAEVVTSEPDGVPSVHPGFVVGDRIDAPKVTRTPSLAVNPVPVMTNGAPTGPVATAGLREIDSVVTWNDPTADWPPTSVARTVVPEVPDGTGNVQVNTPVAFAESVPELQVVTVTPSNTSDVIAVETENPVPRTSTGDPTGPWPGDTAIAGVVTVNEP
jgi:hypothetical protein